MANINEDYFFKKATQLLCSSLEIEVALGRCREFISRFIPADEMTLNLYDPNIEAVRCLARANAEKSEKSEYIIRVPKKQAKYIANGQRVTDILIMNHLNEDPFGKMQISTLGLMEVSSLALRLNIEGKKIGIADLFSKGKDRYTQAHAKNFSVLRDPLSLSMINALHQQELIKIKDQLSAGNPYFSQKLFFPSKNKIIGVNSGLKHVLLMANQVAPLNNTVLLLGETGVGKEVIANAIHQVSPRRSGPFIKVNCGAIPESLIDSELFGHEKGAFTGAIDQKRGLFERADGGTIFLDEIGELPLPAQIRLLHVLQTHEIKRVGGTLSIPLDIRVITATHRNLESMVTKGQFREDLWFRINVFPITLPPLRQRKKDIPALVRHFFERKSRELGFRAPPFYSQKALKSLLDYEWRGNVRELENVVERALIQCRNKSFYINQFDVQTQIEQKNARPGNFNRPRPLDDVIKHHIEQTLEITDGKVHGEKGAAVLLDVNPSTLKNRMNRLGILYGRAFRKQAPSQ